MRQGCPIPSREGRDCRVGRGGKGRGGEGEWRKREERGGEERGGEERGGEGQTSSFPVAVAIKG